MSAGRGLSFRPSFDYEMNTLSSRKLLDMSSVYSELSFDKSVGSYFSLLPWRDSFFNPPKDASKSNIGSRSVRALLLFVR